MRFIADENVDSSIVSALRDSGHDVWYVAEEARAIAGGVLPSARPCAPASPRWRPEALRIVPELPGGVGIGRSGQAGEDRIEGVGWVRVFA